MKRHEQVNKNNFMVSIYFSSVIFIIMGVKLFSAIPKTPEDLAYKSKPKKTDLIVFLEGEHYIRIDHAFTLAYSGYANVIFCPGLLLEKNITYLEERIKSAEKVIKYYEGEGAVSTYGEARETKRFLRNRNVNSLILVTSPYHSYRAWWVFKKVLGGVEIIPVPVPFENNWFKLEDAVRGSFQYEVYQREQIKFAITFMLFGWWECF
jgi:uncharacterized SAM-binding protein YcdF (DUF218 family)